MCSTPALCGWRWTGSALALALGALPADARAEWIELEAVGSFAYVVPHSFDAVLVRLESAGRSVMWAGAPHHDVFLQPHPATTAMATLARGANGHLTVSWYAFAELAHAEAFVEAQTAAHATGPHFALAHDGLHVVVVFDDAGAPYLSETVLLEVVRP